MGLRQPRRPRPPARNGRCIGALSADPSDTVKAVVRHVGAPAASWGDALPERPNRVLLDGRVGRDDHQAIHDRPADQPSVEGIAVQPWQLGFGQRGRFAKRQLRDRVRVTQVGYEPIGRLGQRQSARTVLHRDLPRRDGAWIHRVARIGECRSRGRRQLGWIRSHPQRGARSEEQSQGAVDSKDSRISSGSGSKKDGGTTERPLATPWGGAPSEQARAAGSRPVPHCGDTARRSRRP